jgi:hypothetical protein
VALQDKRTGDPCEETGIYTAACGCGFTIRVIHAHLFPECILCGQDVAWHRGDGIPKPKDEPLRDVVDDSRRT